MRFLIFSGSVVISPFSFLILIWVLCWFSQRTSSWFCWFLFFFFNLFFLFGSVDSLYSSFCFHLVDFSPEFDISCCLLLLGKFASFCSRAFRCAVKLLVYAHFSFFWEALRAMSFPLTTDFIVSHKFWYDVSSFSLNSKKPLHFFFISSLTKLSLSCSGSMYMCIFSCFCWYLRQALVNDNLVKEEIKKLKTL